MARRHAEKDASERPAAGVKAAAGRGTRAKTDAGADGVAAKTGGRQSEAQLLARLGALEKERDALLVDVQALQQRCRALEDTTANVRNRLAWAIDAVESVLQNKG